MAKKPTTTAANGLEKLSRSVIHCRRCPRLNHWCGLVAKEKRAAYRDQSYWGKPLPGFGDPFAHLVVVGLAPAAHGANRTGRMFTGDRSGEWLYRAMHRAGFASQPHSVSREDGLILHDAYITAIVRCAPPLNKPLPEERDNCIPYLREELALLPNASVLLALGAFAWNGLLSIFGNSPRPRFGHGAESHAGAFTLLGSFHPSQQNTFTGRLTEPMLDDVFRRAKELAGAKA